MCSNKMEDALKINEAIKDLHVKNGKEVYWEARSPCTLKKWTQTVKVSVRVDSCYKRVNYMDWRVGYEIMSCVIVNQVNKVVILGLIKMWTNHRRYQKKKKLSTKSRGGKMIKKHQEWHFSLWWFTSRWKFLLMEYTKSKYQGRRWIGKWWTALMVLLLISRE